MLAMNRKTALENMIQFKLPIEQAISDLAQFEWDSEVELVSLETAHIQNALQLYTQGTISTSEVEAWANAIECRVDIKIEPSLVNEALHELANPLLTQPLSVERANFWLSQPLLANPARQIYLK
jgi:hypothetical protein